MAFRNKPENKKEKNNIIYYERDDIKTDAGVFKRIAIQTHFVNRKESYLDLISKYVVPFYETGDIVSISEKVISMCQDNIVEKQNVKVGFWANFLSKFASSNNHGVGMDEPYKLQLAINLAGLPRVLWASMCSAVTKLFGKKGVFYKIVGHDVAGIDGFYNKSAFELYHNIALLNPIAPDKVCNEIYNKFKISNMIVDANDLEVTILGKSYSLINIKNENLIEMIKDNPAGQSDELTPIIIIKPKSL